MRIKTCIFYNLILTIILTSCTKTSDYKQDLLSDDKHKIIKASYELGEIGDTTAVRGLLRKALDPRITHNSKFYGATVNYIRLIALQKISNNAYNKKITQHNVDTTAILFFRDWAIKNGYLKNEIDININYY